MIPSILSYSILSYPRCIYWIYLLNPGKRASKQSRRILIVSTFVALLYSFVHQTGINEGKLREGGGGPTDVERARREGEGRKKGRKQGRKEGEEERINGCERQVSQLGNFRVHDRPRPIPDHGYEVVEAATPHLAPHGPSAPSLLPFPSLPLTMRARCCPTFLICHNL